ncbi:MAG: hypothetical protein OYH76_18385 [Defluviicoccus sp.]|nr:hypothetical protein [Defluviicoccus sp.]MDE0277867.1 hypothetical protein [Defluviicoccus sp.]
MSDEILTMLGVGVALGLFVWRINAGMEQRLDKRIDRLADDRRTLVGEISGLRERMGRVEERMGQVEGQMARIEGLSDGFVRRTDPDAPASA